MMVMHGQGLLMYSESNYYKGQFNNGIKEGYGMEVKTNNKYKGNFS